MEVGNREILGPGPWWARAQGSPHAQNVLDLKASPLPPAPQDSLDFHDLSCFFVDFRRLFVDVRGFSLILVDVRGFSLIFVDFHICSWIPVDFNRCLLIFIDFCGFWCPVVSGIWYGWLAQRPQELRKHAPRVIKGRAPGPKTLRH